MNENSGQGEAGQITHVDENEFQKYFDRLEGTEESYEIRLYRRIRATNKKLVNTFLKKYIDECPDEETIGNEFGGGQYMLIHYQDKGGRLEKTIWIDELFTKRLEEKNRVSGMAPNMAELQPAARLDPLETFSKIVNDMLKPMVSMFQQNQAAAAQATPAAMDPAQMAVTMMERMTDSMASSLAKVQDRIIDKQLDKLDDPKEASEPISDKMSLIKEILDVAKQFGDGLLNSSGIKEKLMKQSIANSDEFKAIQQDPDMFDALYTEAVQDPEIGKDKADKLFKKLGFEIGNP